MTENKTNETHPLNFRDCNVLLHTLNAHGMKLSHFEDKVRSMNGGTVNQRVFEFLFDCLAINNFSKEACWAILGSDCFNE